MKKLLFIVVVISAIACNKKIEDPYERINGKWTIENSFLGGQQVPGDGSYLSFTQCSTPPCPGQDYKESDKSLGNITFEIASDESTITIVDTTSDGGAYDGTWEVTLFSNSRLHIQASTFLGTFKMEMTKD